MQIVIDIHEKDLECLKRTGQVTYSLVDGILKGIVLPNNATNGEIIMALFGADKIYSFGNKVEIREGHNMTDKVYARFSKEWCNEPYTFKMCYQEGFDDCYKKVEEEQSNAIVNKEEVAKLEYERGLNDAWECVRKFILSGSHGGLELYEIEKIFGTGNFPLIVKDFSAQECMARIKEYEETQKIKVGDIVTIGEDTEEFIVTWVGTDEVTLISRSGFHARTAHIDCLTKTGEHCDIEKCFKCKVF